MTLFAVRAREDLLAVRFAISPVWETQAAVQAFADERGRVYHQPWLQLVQGRAARLDLAPLLAVLPRRGYVPDFLIPPPQTGRPALRDQLAEIRATGPTHVARELQRCRDSLDDEQHRRLLDGMLADPEHARDQLTDRLHDAWTSLVAPFWVRIRTLLDHDIEERSRALARHGLRRVLDELHPKISWTKRGLSLADRTGRTVVVGERGFLLMPSAYLWPHVAAIIEEPWLPTIVYPAAGIAGLWQAPDAPPGALGRLLGHSRALILAALAQPRSTTALAAATGLSPAGVSRHLLALRDAGLLATARHGHEVRYRRTELGSALLHACRDVAPRRDHRLPGPRRAGRRAPLP
jgi:DNA-binding transcriptional ArsR family regulator